jgi:predicted metal-dependent enzyme (double-stranded beta helix superfamily)
MSSIAPLRDFVVAMTALADSGADEARFLAEGKPLLTRLIGEDIWLPDDFAAAGPSYRQYLLHCDPAERFSVVSFVWGPGQRTPIHDHLTWGMVGMLRGAEISIAMHPDPAGGPVRAGERDRLAEGEVVAVSPALGDVHVVENALADRASISIHVYGGNIGCIRRHVFDAETSATRPFVSGYQNAVVPNLWVE